LNDKKFNETNLAKVIAVARHRHVGQLWRRRFVVDGQFDGAGDSCIEQQQ
jgi:hypothetical protein